MNDEKLDSSNAATGSGNASDMNMAQLSFGLHPERSVRIALLEEVMDPANKAKASLSFNPNDENDGVQAAFGRFCIINAVRIVSIEHISIAANNALIREGSRMNKLNSNMKDLQLNRPEQSVQHNQKGISSDFIYAVGGSQNEQSVMKDYGFQGEESSNLGPACVVACGFDASVDEMNQFLQILGGSHLDFSYFSRKRTEPEIKDMIKAFKLSPNEFDPEIHQELAEAVVHRVATKFVS